MRRNIEVSLALAFALLQKGAVVESMIQRAYPTVIDPIWWQSHLPPNLTFEEFQTLNENRSFRVTVNSSTLKSLQTLTKSIYD